MNVSVSNKEELLKRILHPFLRESYKLLQQFTPFSLFTKCELLMLSWKLSLFSIFSDACCVLL